MIQIAFLTDPHFLAFAAVVDIIALGIVAVRLELARRNRAATIERRLG